MNFTTQITENVDNATKTFVDANERILDAVMTVNRRVVDTVLRTNQNIADRAPKFDMPLADRLLTPAQTAARYIDVVERAVSLNRDFTATMVGQLPTGVAAAAKNRATTASK